MDRDEIKAVMDEMPYGLYIVGSRMGDQVNGMMADWVMQVSFNPRLLAVSFENDAQTLANVRESGSFTVNFLPEEAMELAAHFAQPYHGDKIKGRDAEEKAMLHKKLEGIAYATTASGCPILEEAMAWLECEAEAFHPTGDHTLVVGKVVDGRLLRDAEPLTSTYTGWTYSG
jgi:flavin reductase (DIM6/NTAB) family NADH-FMN oxidoreductase RutF